LLRQGEVTLKVSHGLWHPGVRPDIRFALGFLP
jgi:hypothetical protein